MTQEDSRPSFSDYLLSMPSKPTASERAEEGDEESASLQLRDVEWRHLFA